MVQGTRVQGTLSVAWMQPVLYVSGMLPRSTLRTPWSLRQYFVKTTAYAVYPEGAVVVDENDVNCGGCSFYKMARDDYVVKQLQ